MSKTNARETITRPTIGEIHSRRASAEKIFGVQSDFQSSASSISSNKSNGSREKKRPCLIWRTVPNVQILAMARFNGTDVTDRNISFMDHLPREYVLKRLLAVHEKQPFGERRSITAVTRTGSSLNKNIYLILIPTLDEDEHPYEQSSEYFPQAELEYIRKILFAIQTEETEEQARIIQELNPPSAYNDNDDDDKNNTCSSSSSSLSLPRVRTDLAEKINLNKNDLVKIWLNEMTLDNDNVNDDVILLENLRPMILSDDSHVRNSLIMNYIVYVL
ncbi:hypothetical protein I4U23_009956 [Adineta vaga]|nr:hypothetical protein I4U23_009956 [Adineta vaga]